MRRRIINELLVHHPLIIVDVGASGGLDKRWRQLSSQLRSVLFEPDPREFARLKLQISERAENAVVLNSALSDAVKELDFHLCKKQEVSSVYLPNSDFLNKYPDSERFAVEKTIKITTDTLDNQLNKNAIIDIDFIKIDTQWHELLILKGSAKTLGKVIGLEVEVGFAPLYIGQPLFNEVDAFVTSHGFEIIDIKRCFFNRINTKDYGKYKGQLMYGDALYFKSPETICMWDDISPEKVIHAICIYLVYRYPDLAETLANISFDTNLLSINEHRTISSIVHSFKDKNIIPNFRGKSRIYELIKKLADMFSCKEWYSGGDKMLGNT